MPATTNHGAALLLLCAILLSLAVTAGAAVLTVWLVFRPSHLKVYVESADLPFFDVADTTFNYSLSLDVSIRSPNKRLSIYYDSVEAAALYAGKQVGYDISLPAFFQDVENTTVVHPKFQELEVPVTALMNETYAREAEEGWLSMEVRIYTKVRFKAWFVKTGRYKPKFVCNLKLPAPSPATSEETFSRTKCSVDIFG